MLDWHDILCNKNNLSPMQYPQNTQNLLLNNNSADCAYFAEGHSKNKNGEQSTDKIIETQKYGSYTLQQLQEFLDEQWDEYKNDEQALHAWAELLHQRGLIEQGIKPPNFTATTTCAYCEIIPCPPELTNGGQVLGCMWCWNRVHGLPIPKLWENDR